MDAVGANAPAGPRILRSAEILKAVGDEVETVDVRSVRVLDPHLVVDWRAVDREVAKLPAGGVPLLGRRPHREFLGLLVELADGALVHHTDPRIVVPVDLKVERAERPARLDDRYRILR